MRRRGQVGMTLLELTVAMALLATITTFTWLTVDGTRAVAIESSRRSDLNQMGRNAMAIMRRELAASFISTNQTDYYKTVFKATDRDPFDEVHFVARAHEHRYADRKEGDIAEFGYWSEPDKRGGNYRSLMHREAPIVDDDPENGGTVHALSHSVRSLNLRYYDATKEEWLDEWDSESSEQTGRVPKAIEIRLELEDDEGRVVSYYTRTPVLP